LRRAPPFAPVPPDARIPWTAVSLVAAFALLILTGLLWHVVTRPFYGPGPLEELTSWRDFLVFVVGFFSLLILLTIAWVKWVELRSLASIGLAGARVPRRWIQWWLIGAAMVGAVVVAATLSGALRVEAWSLGEMTARRALVATLLLGGFAVQAAGEEILFRGMLLSDIAVRRGPLAAVVLSSLLFALSHFDGHDTVLQVLNLTLFGAFLALVAMTDRDLVGACGWHAGWNWLLCLGFSLPLSGSEFRPPGILATLVPVGPTWMTGGEFGLEASVFATVLLSLGIWWKRAPLLAAPLAA
jgi:membrane protease YdiL (CAAX protease family)